MNLKFEYKIVFENNLRHESWDRMGVFDEKAKFKNLLQVYLKGPQLVAQKARRPVLKRDLFMSL
jgi:hypothetical protein